jgi:hypothetical protein
VTLEECSEGQCHSTIVAFIEVGLFVEEEVAPSFGSTLFRIAADDASAVCDGVRFPGESGQLAGDEIDIFFV